MFVTNCISTTKIQKISEITNFFRHYFLSRTEVLLNFLALLSLDFLNKENYSELRNTLKKKYHSMNRFGRTS